MPDPKGKTGMTEMNSQLYLDIDAVLNSETWFRTRPKRPKGTIVTEEEHWRDALDPACVARLNTILAQTNCDLIISSTWRKFLQLDELFTILANRGLENHFAPKFIGKTPVLDKERGYEIQESLDAFPKNIRFCILDDDGDMCHLMHKLVQCDPRVGLTDENVRQVIQMLNE